MNASSAILGFTLTALLLTLTPGLDTALVLRTAAVQGGRKAMGAGAGIVTGVLIWGLVAALGLGAVLAVSRLAYTLLQIDMTDNTPAQQALLDELGLFGPPAILFYQASGSELSNARVLGEMDRDQFLEHVANVGQKL